MGCITVATWIGVSIGAGNGLLPHSTEPLPEPMLTFREVCLRITLLKLLPQCSVATG